MKTNLTHWQKAGLGFATTFTLLLGLLLVLGYSAVGNKVVVWGANKLVTGLELNLSQGKLLSGGKIDVKYQTQQLSINISDLYINLDWFDCATACFSINGESLDLEVFKPKAPAEPLEQEDNEDSTLSPPLHIAFKTLDFAKITINTTDLSVAINNLHLQADWQQDLLSIAALNVKSVVLRQAGQSNELNNIAVKANITPNLISWQDLHVSYQSMNVNSKGQLNKSTHWQIASTTVISKDEHKLTLQTAGTMADLTVKADVKGQYKGQAEALVNLTQDNYPFSLKADLPAQSLAGLLSPPLQDLLLKQTSIIASGDANNYLLALNSTVHAIQVGTVEVKLKVTGGLKQAKVTFGEVSIDDANAEFTGAVDWQNGIQATAKGNLHKLPLHLLLPDESVLPNNSSHLSGHFEVAFNALAKQWQLTVPSLVLQGQVQNKPIKANVQLELNEQLIGQIEQLELTYGDSHIQLSGTLADQVSLNGNVTMNHHNDALLPLNLNLQGNLSLSGPRETPKVELNAKLNSLAYDQVSLHNGQLDLTIDGSNNFLTDVKLRANQLTANDLSLSNISLDANGDINSHQLSLTSKGAIDSEVKLNGSWQNNQWQGLLQQLEVNYKATEQNPAIKAKLVDSVQVVASAKQMSLSNHCWQIARNELCLQANHKNENGHSFGQSSVLIKQLQLADANHWLQDKLRLTGDAKGQLQIAWQDGQLTKAIGEIQGQKITLQPLSPLHSKAQPNQPILPIEKLTLNLSSDDAQAKLDWQLQSSLIGQINGAFRSPIGKDTQPKIVGHVEITKMTLSPLAPLLSQVLRQPITLNGQVNGKVTLNDLSQATQLNGKITVSDFAIATGAIPIALHKSKIELDLQGYLAKLTCQLYGQQGGTLALNGNVDWQNELSVTLSAVGHDFLVSPEPNIKLTLSPNLTLNYAANKAKVVGELTVPFGRIKMESLPKGAIVPSVDQIIVDDQTIQTGTVPIDYIVDLDVIIKDDFRVKAMGLDSYIAGQIDLTKQNAKPLLASGELSLREGTYKALGQDLEIQTGQIGFNGPLDKPYVNVRAIRNPEATANKVVAGVELSGNISKPVLVIFTEPVMDQAHALAYLLNGQPLGEGESSNASMLTQLILSQSIDRSRGLVSKVGEKLGFEDVNLSAKGSGQDTKVEVSGYITPNIQVSYRMGVFDSLNEFAVRYRVFSKLFIEATNGLYDSIDLLYEFDWE
jgi:translocation and assembly module TamB